MMFQTTRGKYTFLAPVAQTAGSARETYLSNFWYTTRPPLTYSSATNRYGPEPTISVTGFSGAVLAKRSGIMNGTDKSGLPSAVASSGKGCFSLITSVLSSAAA